MHFRLVNRVYLKLCNSRTECTFSPRDELCITGTSAKRAPAGKLICLEKNTFKPAYQIEYPATVNLFSYNHDTTLSGSIILKMISLTKGVGAKYFRIYAHALGFHMSLVWPKSADLTAREFVSLAWTASYVQICTWHASEKNAVTASSKEHDNRLLCDCTFVLTC